MSRQLRLYLLALSFVVGITAKAAAQDPTFTTIQPPDAFNMDEGERVEGSWYITVQVTEPSPATFDALYGFAKGGVFTRIDGRNNAPALGTWKRTEGGGIIFSNILFNFSAGVRTGYITGEFAARVVDGTLTGTFTAEGHGIPGFLPRSGTFTGTRIAAEAPK
jgi:hypothetical protein